MFDKLVESDTGAEFKNRSRYFMVSSIVVGILFLTAVVYSLYAADIGIGNSDFDLAELVSPLTESEPEVPKPIEQRNTQQPSTSALPVRTQNIARPDEYMFVPDKPSSEPSSIPTRPIGKFIIDPNGTNSGKSGTPDGSSIGRTGGTASSMSVNEPPEEYVKSDPPPPVVSKPPIVKSEGVINGKATYLPVPLYPAPAKAVGAMGEVKVQVTIDEEGRVISAKAVSGHPLLRQAAETSARNAKFSTTYLSRVPVKVTGVIMYNFKRP